VKFFTKALIGLAGVGGVAWGVQELRLAGAASETPTRMTCKELGEKGAAGNAHVVLTDFLLTGDVVYEHKRKSSDTEKWTKVWVPAVPLDSPYALALRDAGANNPPPPPPRPVHVIAVFTDAKNERDLAALGAKTELDGMVVNVISSLGGEEEKLLKGTYGDVSKAQIFEVGRKPAKSLYAFAGIGVGAAVALGMLVSFFRRRKPAEAA